jgi:hypothetical protein
MGLVGALRLPDEDASVARHAPSDAADDELGEGERPTAMACAATQPVGRVMFIFLRSSWAPRRQIPLMVAVTVLV